MQKVQIVVLDNTGDAEKWIDENINEANVDICEVLTLGENSPIPIYDLPLYDNWDVLLVFEQAKQKELEDVLEKIGISKDRILFAYDFDGSLSEKYNVSNYIFKDHVRRLLRYALYRKNNEKYAMVAADGMTYISTSGDNIILPTMAKLQENWAKREMHLFHQWSLKYYDFTFEQKFFCDIGANIGTTSLYFKNQIEPDVNIIAFEPLYENYKMLLANAIINDVDITQNYFVNAGVSDTAVKRNMKYDQNNPGASSLVKDNTNGEEIQLLSFDQYLEESNVEPQKLKYIWVDVEGYEAKFLKGAYHTLKNSNAAVFMEFTPSFYFGRDGEFETLVEEIEKHFNYFIFGGDLKSVVRPVSDLRRYQNEKYLHEDIFLIRNTR